MYSKLLQEFAQIDWIVLWRCDFHSAALRALSD